MNNVFVTFREDAPPDILVETNVRAVPRINEAVELKGVRYRVVNVIHKLDSRQGLSDILVLCERLGLCERFGT